uniref:Transmembrane BAX inhibitor motif containing 6 n=1 Tax=Gallus gallus TaxID=9031 RepID=A0A8V0ZYT1_CHICK
MRRSGGRDFAPRPPISGGGRSRVGSVRGPDGRRSAAQPAAQCSRRSLGTMNVFDRSINLDALFKFSHISASTQEHLKRVYGSFALCMLLAAVGAYVNVVTHLFQFSLLSGLGSLGLMVWLTATPHSRETEQQRLGMLAGFAFLTALSPPPSWARPPSSAVSHSVLSMPGAAVFSTWEVFCSPASLCCCSPLCLTHCWAPCGSSRPICTWG